MTDKGLKGVNNPSAMFLSQHGQEVPGSCVLVTQEGTRPLLVEVQALVDQAHGNPRRLTVGLDAQRLAMLLAVLHRQRGPSQPAPRITSYNVCYTKLLRIDIEICRTHGFNADNNPVLELGSETWVRRQRQI